MDDFKGGPLFGFKSNVTTARRGGAPPDEDQLISFYNGKLLTSTPNIPKDTLGEYQGLNVFLENNPKGFSYIRFHRNGEIVEISNEDFFNKMKEIFGSEDENVSESD